MARKWLTPEEVELADVERQMEEQLVAQHRLVDRVIAQRSEPDGSLRYLAKVRSLWGSRNTPRAWPALPPYQGSAVHAAGPEENALLHISW